MSDATDITTAERDALQTALAGEHAAVWTLALLGARTSQSAEPGLTGSLDAAYAAHQQTRDDLIATIAGLGLSPVVAATTSDLRRTAIGLLDATAVRALGFRGTPETLPGAPELADR